MTTEDLLIHNGGYRQTVETISEGLPQLNIKPSFAYKKTKRVERIHLQLFSLVISQPQDYDFNFLCLSSTAFFYNEQVLLVYFKNGNTFKEHLHTFSKVTKTSKIVLGVL